MAGDLGFYNPLAPRPAVIEGLRGQLPHSGRRFAICATLRRRDTNGALTNSTTRDLRAGVQSFGWYNISHLVVHLWLHSSRSRGPARCPRRPSFPAIRRRALRSTRADDRFPCSHLVPHLGKLGDDWVSPNEWNCPSRCATSCGRPIRRTLSGDRGQTGPWAFWVG